MTVAVHTSHRHAEDEVLASGRYQLTRRDLNEIAAMIYSDAGISLNGSKASLVYSRLSKHIRNLGLSGFRAYCSLVASPEGAGASRNAVAPDDQFHASSARTTISITCVTRCCRR